MGSPLGQVLADIFMIELENSLPPNLTKHITFWKWYVGDTICLVKIGTTEFIISVLNSFDKNIQFTFEEEIDETIPLVYWKSCCNDLYINWNAIAPATWKRGTSKTLAEWAYAICSTDQLLDRE